jgi:tetratricopeptide (TPR) repeat protein
MRLKWLIVPVGMLLTAVVALAWDWYSVVPPEEIANAHYVGRDTCAQCHQKEHSLWLGSDHDRAMEIASEASVLGDFNDASFTYQGVTTRFFKRDGKFMVNTEGPDGQHHDYEVKYTFGVRPLQQYMVEFPDGRVQVLRESWDTENKKWFFVTPPDVTNERILPGDPFHWTGITQNWNVTCADCHSTNVHKNYNPKTDSYKTSFEEIDVSCEECHGPGSVHVGLAKSWSPTWDREVGYGLPALKEKHLDTQIETCAKCHARRRQIHEDFRPGKPMLDYYDPFLLDDGLYHANGNILDEVYEYGSFMQSKMHANHVRCSDCHDPHSLKLKFQGNALCTQCHVPGKYDTPAHHHHEVGTPGASCIECHMPSRLYMVIDKRRDHSFRVPRPDLTVELGTPNSCNDCHTKPEENAKWAADWVRNWYGEKRPDDPHWARALAAGRAVKPEGEQMLLDVLSRRETPAIVQATAVGLLANYSSEAAANAMREALYHTDALVRLSAVQSVPIDQRGSTLPDLARMLSDPLLRIRTAAAGRLVDVPVDMLDRLLTDKQRSDFEDAMIELRESQEMSFDQAGGHLSRAGLAKRYGRPEEAIEHLQAAIRLQPYLAGARGELASMYSALRDPLTGGYTHSTEAEIRRLRQEEVELLKRDAKLAPDNAGVFYQLGLQQNLLENLDGAQEALRAAAEKAPHVYQFKWALALLYEKRYSLKGDASDFNHAIDLLRQCNEMEPNDRQAQLVLMKLLETRSQREAAGVKAPGEDKQEPAQDVSEPKQGTNAPPDANAPN